MNSNGCDYWHTFNVSSLGATILEQPNKVGVISAGVQGNNVKMPVFADPKVIAKRDCLKGQINDAFLEFIRHELWKNDIIMEKWEEAYSRSGKGSAGVRAKDVNAIFDLGAPRFKDYIYDMNKNQKRYIEDTMGIVRTVLEENDCVLSKFE